MAPFNFESERCIFRALAHEKPDGGCRKPKGLADIIFHVSFIGKMHQLRLIHKQDERGRLNRYLCCIVDFQAGGPYPEGGSVTLTASETMSLSVPVETRKQFCAYAKSACSITLPTRWPLKAK